MALPEALDVVLGSACCPTADRQILKASGLACLQAGTQASPGAVLDSEPIAAFVVSSHCTT